MAAYRTWHSGIASCGTAQEFRVVAAAADTLTCNSRSACKEIPHIYGTRKFITVLIPRRVTMSFTHTNPVDILKRQFFKIILMSPFEMNSVFQVVSSLYVLPLESVCISHLSLT
jgi:hypothetical protein